MVGSGRYLANPCSTWKFGWILFFRVETWTADIGVWHDAPEVSQFGFSAVSWKGKEMSENRRMFLAEVGQGMLVASLGSAIAAELGLSPAAASEARPKALDFGELEPLVSLMQETPVSEIQPKLIECMAAGDSLQRLVVAGALANERTFGGQDYTGFHTFMALAPALDMARQLPEAERPLPVMKVLYRNTSRIQECGGRSQETLHEVEDLPQTQPTDELAIQRATRKADFDLAESVFALVAQGPREEAYHLLQYAVQDEVDVHRTVLAWRAWSMIELAGEQHAHTLLRQSVRYCVDSERSLQKNHRNPSGIRQVLPALLSDLGLLDRKPGTRTASDEELRDLAGTVFRSSRDAAATAMASALASGLSIESASEALSLAANHLLLHDPGRSEQQASAGKPKGSVHGASVGVHACDSANAWRNIAMVSETRNQFASMIVGAYHTAGQAGAVGTNDIPFAERAEEIDTSGSLMDCMDEAVQQNDQLLASAAAHRHLKSGGDEAEVLRRLLTYAVSQEGALHAEKFYRTVMEETAKTRPSQRHRHLVALARVTASEYGFPAAGQDEARELLDLPADRHR